MAHTKAGGTARNLKDSPGRRLGLKKGNGETVAPGNILIRQRGFRYLPGSNVRAGKDQTLFAVKTGKVSYERRRTRNHAGTLVAKVLVNIIP